MAATLRFPCIQLSTVASGARHMTACNMQPRKPSGCQRSYVRTLHDLHSNMNELQLPELWLIIIM